MTEQQVPERPLAQGITQLEIDQRVFDLYDEYCHGRIDRREFGFAMGDHVRMRGGNVHTLADVRVQIVEPRLIERREQGRPALSQAFRLRGDRQLI